MTAPDTTAAIAALVHRLKNRGDEDDEVFALEYVTALRGQGWRMTEAKVPVAWAPVPVTPGAAERGAAAARELLAHRHDGSDAA